MTANTQTTADSNDQTTAGSNGNHPSVSAERPVRRDFYMTVVLGPNGSVVDEATWKQVGGDKTGRDLNKALKKEKMTVTRVFQADKWNEARSNFRMSRRQGQQNARQALLDESFASAGQPHNKRVENALKTLMPLFRDAPPAKVAQSFDRIIKAIVHAAGDLPKEAEVAKEAEAGATDESKANLH